MEEELGRPLDTNEHVHHINGDKQDNRPENLVVMTNAEHQRFHEHPQMYQRSRVELTCQQCGSAYERKRSRADNSRWCSRACQIQGLQKLRSKD